MEQPRDVIVHNDRKQHQQEHQSDLNEPLFERHAEIAAQSALDRGAPVSEFTVARELGHGGTAMIRKVYGHLGQVRHRCEAVEYRMPSDVSFADGGVTALVP